MNPIRILRAQVPPDGITRRELSHATGVSYPTLSNIEQGLTLTISDRVAQRLAKYFQVNPYSSLQEEYESYRQSLSQ